LLDPKRITKNGPSKKKGKAKFMKVTVNPTNTECFKAGNHTFGKVSEFKYLGTFITSNDS